jgi:crotonobetainyl-CoA:carnitine CoA-transferase CaiB-like acyl-CoA transferase
VSWTLAAIAGPFCAALRDGADVIRIEKVDGGEDRWTTPVAAGGGGAVSCSGRATSAG